MGFGEVRFQRDGPLEVRQSVLAQVQLCLQTREIRHRHDVGRSNANRALKTAQRLGVARGAKVDDAQAVQRLEASRLRGKMPAYSRSALSSFPCSSNSIARCRACNVASSQSRSKLQAMAFAN